MLYYTTLHYNMLYYKRKLKEAHSDMAKVNTRYTILHYTILCYTTLHYTTICCTTRGSSRRPTQTWQR